MSSGSTSTGSTRRTRDWSLRSGRWRRSPRSLYLSYEKPDGSYGGSYEVGHGTYTTGFVDGTARVIWSAETSVADLRADLTRLAG